jgi:hypothetical protein
LQSRRTAANESGGRADLTPARPIGNYLQTSHSPAGAIRPNAIDPTSSAPAAQLKL